MDTTGCAHTYTHIHTRTHTYNYPHTYTKEGNKGTRTHILTHEHVQCAHTYSHTYTQTYTHIHTRTHAYTRVHMYTHDATTTTELDSFTTHINKREIHGASGWMWVIRHIDTFDTLLLDSCNVSMYTVDTH